MMKFRLPRFLTSPPQSADANNEACNRLCFDQQVIPLACIVWTADFHIKAWNPAAERIFGWSSQEVLGRNGLELLTDGAGRSAIATLWSRLLAGETLDRHECDNLRKDGANIVCAWHFSALRDSSGRIDSILSLADDITERCRSEAAERTQFEQLATIFDSINALVYVSDMESYELLFVNRYGRKLFGDDWHGITCYRYLQADTDVPCFFCDNDELIVDGIVQPAVVREMYNNRSGRWFQCIDRAIRWSDKRLVRLQIAFDITERKESERLKEELLSTIGHELRTPLTAMMGYAELLHEPEVDHATRIEYAGIIMQSSERLARLIDNFLALHRQRSNRQPHHPSPINLLELLRVAVDLVRVTSDKHRFVCDLPDDLPLIMGDEELIHRVFLNLLANAVKFSPNGGNITVAARRSDGKVRIEVRDEGIGIESDQLGRIFEWFYCVDGSDRRAFGGAGLGLALVKEGVEAHGGKVWAESAQGSGSSFFVELPLPKD